MAAKVSSMLPTCVRSGLKVKSPVTTLNVALSGRGRGVTEKVTAPPSEFVALTVKLRELPTSTILSPTGSSWGPRETSKVEESEAKLPARSETETETV